MNKLRATLILFVLFSSASCQAKREYLSVAEVASNNSSRKEEYKSDSRKKKKGEESTENGCSYTVTKEKRFDRKEIKEKAENVCAVLKEHKEKIENYCRRLRNDVDKKEYREYVVLMERAAFPIILLCEYLEKKEIEDYCERVREAAENEDNAGYIIRVHEAVRAMFVPRRWKPSDLGDYPYEPSLNPYLYP